MPDARMKMPPFKATKDIVFDVIKDGERRTVTVPLEKAEELMPVYGFHFALFAGGGGSIRILR